MEIKFDQSSLPQDGQRIIFQTYDEQRAGLWHEGHYCAADGIIQGGKDVDPVAIHEVVRWELMASFSKAPLSQN